MLASIIAIGAIAATVIGATALTGRYRPAPAYDWPIWAYRLALAVKARFRPRHGTWRRAHRVAPTSVPR
jgi:hypothetical protein